MKLSFCPFCTYVQGNDLSYLNHVIIAHYNASYGCRKCLKQAFVSSSALHNHKKVCLGLTSRKSTRGSDGRPSSSRGDSSCRGSSKATPKKEGKAPPLIPRAPAPFLLPNHHHAAVDKRPPTTTSPTRRTQVGKKRRQKMRAQPGRAPATRHARTVAATSQTPCRCLQTPASFQ